jgi:homoserine kinase type II
LSHEETTVPDHRAGPEVREVDLRDGRWEIDLEEGRARPARESEGGLAPDTLERLRAAYDLGEWLIWQRTPGSTNRSFFVTTTTGEYVLRLSNQRKTEAARRYEVTLIEYLRAAGYPAPRVVPTRTGEEYRAGPHLHLLTERIPGDPFDPDDPVHLQEAGRALARYHHLVRGFPDRFRAETRPVLPTVEKNGPLVLATFAGIAHDYMADDARRRLSRASSYLWSQFIRVPEALAGVLPALPRLVIQGSFGPSSLIYDGDGRVAGVVDYDRSAYDLRALDLAQAMEAFALAPDPARPQGGVGLDFERCASFMAAYAEVERMPVQELAALPLVFRAQRLVRVLCETTSFLNKHRAAHHDEEDLLGVVDMAETEADRLRWLEEHEAPLLRALGSTLVG